MTDSQATDFVTFDFKGPCVCYFAVGSTDHRMNFCLVHNAAKLPKCWKQENERNAYMHLEATDI